MNKLFVFCCIFIFSCTKKKATTICNTNEPFEADFRLGENLIGYGMTETDTIIKFSFFAEASKNYMSYNWKVGDHPGVFSGKSVSLNFSGSQVGKTIPVTLIASGKAKEECISSPVRFDTVQKNIAILYPKGFGKDSLFDPAYVVELPFLGRWQGSFTDSPADTFTVHIVNNGPNNSSSFTQKSYGVRIYNLPENCSGNPNDGTCGFVTPGVEYFGYPTEVSYKSFYAEDNGFLSCCPKAKLFGRIDKGDYNKLVITCSFFTSENGIQKETKKIFEGRRL